MTRAIVIRQYLPYPPEVVWEALTDSDKLGAWFMPGNFKPVPGLEFTFRKPPQKGWDGITWCRVLEVKPLQFVSYTYSGKASAEKTLACADIHSNLADAAGKGIFTELDTILSFSLEKQGDGTLFTLKHSGFTGFKLVVVSLVMGKGWKKLIREKLPRVLKEISEHAR
ncbi:MAG TPA: SRPBCC domain-containing protein [Bacteroidia bacterium]|jgi:uncharacterized protein YndB with AHSA1/START domain|nr:SRPBCC domain-containing protein [Bacteroidia bacterium]